MENVKKYITSAFIGVITMIIMLMGLSACGSSQNKVIGKWYNESEKCLDIRSDGTYKLENDYGVGTWKVLDDKSTLEFTDFYGDTQESKINKDNFGEYIDFGRYGIFYRNSYPSNESDNSDTAGENASVAATDANAVSIAPFEGIAFEVSGISPYCQISINTQNCSSEVQQYIEYTLDKEFYANGETATITAELPANIREKYTLSSPEMKYDITGQPEYITSIDKINMTDIESELNDYITANVASAIKHGQEGYFTSSLLGNDVGCELQSVNCVDPADIYFSSLKPNRISNNIGYFNILSFTYKVSYTGEYDSGTFYSCISAVNIIKYPDGTIKWGSQNSDDFDFVADSSEGSIENCVTTLIMSKSDNYNISKAQLK